LLVLDINVDCGLISGSCLCYLEELSTTDLNNLEISGDRLLLTQ